MSLAHIGSSIAIESPQILLPNGMYLMPLVGSPSDTTDTIPLDFNSGLTYRSDIKKFAGSIEMTQAGSSELRYDITSLGMKDSGCVSVWVYVSNKMTTNNGPLYFLKLGSNVNDGFADLTALRLYDSSKKFEFLMNGNINRSARVADTVGEWIHFVIQWDKNGLPSGAKKELYVDGMLEDYSTTVTTPQAVLTYLRVGNWTNNGLNCPDTMFEQLAIHPGKGFSADEIQWWAESKQGFYDFRDKFLYF
jgi:hypothetical protein